MLEKLFGVYIGTIHDICFFPFKQFTVPFFLKQQYALATFVELVRHLSSLSSVAASPNLVCGVCHVSRLAPPDLVFAMSPSVSAMWLLVFSLSSFCPLVVRPLSALCRPLSAWVYGLALAELL